MYLQHINWFYYFCYCTNVNIQAEKLLTVFKPERSKSEENYLEKMKFERWEWDNFTRTHMVF